MKHFLIFSFLIISTIFSLNNNTLAQMQSGHLYTMTMIPVPNNDIQDFLKFFETDAKPMDAENEYILSEKIFTHAWGPQWTVCIMAEYKDWEGFLAANKKSDELFQKKYPDKTVQDEIGKKWGGYLTNHTDAIVMDHPNLTK